MRDKDFKSGYLTTNYLDKKLETFKLHATDTIADEEEKMSKIVWLIDNINKYRSKVKRWAKLAE